MRRRWIIAAAVATIALSACKKDDSPPSPEPSGETSSPSASVAIGANQYGWDAYGVTAVLTPAPNGWRLKITNKTGDRVDAPGIYALDALDGHRVEATVAGAQPLADGQTATLDVTWPSDFDSRSVGMVMLTIGRDLYGAFYRG